MKRGSLLALALVAGCGGAKVEKPVAEAPIERPARPSQDEIDRKNDEELQVQGELGILEQEQIDGAFRPRTEQINHCYHEVVAKLWYLGGKLELKVRVKRDGGVKEVSLVNPLGSLHVEKCIAGIVRDLSFPKPRGNGEAEFNYSWDFRAKASMKDWTNDDVGRHFDKHKKEIDACEKDGPVPPGLRVTFFVTPGGKVSSVGVGADAPVPEAYAACVSACVQRWKFDDPLGKIARATYQF